MFDVFIMDMGGHEENVANLKTLLPHAQVVRYYDNHLDTLKRCIARCRTPFAWVISSCCSYYDFDFSYRAKPWEAYQIHCWASGSQQYGDTFLVPVAEFKRQQAVERLEWYKDINWHSDGVMRLPWPTIDCPTEDVTSAVRAYEFDTPYAWVNARTKFDAPLWRDRVFYTFNKSNSVSLAPRDIKAHLKTQIYDYPHVLKQNQPVLSDKPLDIIYISNGEPDAELWYEHLLKTVSAAGATNWVRRVKDVNGRSNAYRAAASISQTDWFFAVFAKLEVADTFDWSWQPDYLQEPKHYIFHSKNPVNGLEYGHMGIIAYNRQLVSDTHVPGLDFTLSKPHAVVPVVSGTAHYNTTPELTWRTAFRECIKLFDDVQKNGSIESQYRLDCWLGQAEGEHSMWSLLGAKDAIDYWLTCEGKYEFLILTFEWWWLKDYYAKIYTPNLKISDEYIQESQIQPVQLPGQLALGK
jgi:hypothetical protein